MTRTRLVIDVDLAEEDLRRDPIEVEIPGLGVYEFPGVIPSLAMLRVSRWSTRKRHNLEPTEAIALLGDLVPDEVAAEWSAKGFDMFAESNIAHIEKIVMGLLAEYSRRQTENEPVGKAPEATPASSPNTGHSSSPTSDVNTVSPFHVT